MPPTTPPCNAHQSSRERSSTAPTTVNANDDANENMTDATDDADDNADNSGPGHCNNDGGGHPSGGSMPKSVLGPAPCCRPCPQLMSLMTAQPPPSQSPHCFRRFALPAPSVSSRRHRPKLLFAVCPSPPTWDVGRPPNLTRSRGCEDANEGGQKGAADDVRYDAADDGGAILGVAQPELNPSHHRDARCTEAAATLPPQGRRTAYTPPPFSKLPKRILCGYASNERPGSPPASYGCQWRLRHNNARTNDGDGSSGQQPATMAATRDDGGSPQRWQQPAMTAAARDDGSSPR
ncbi:hypothetical protein BJ912DRAFT_1058015 [Pholiota molesta]|nr:hypothetical protein BJ912DRAFT_1058015 [Pholiota molesta]